MAAMKKQRLPTRPESPACLKLCFVIVNQSVQKKGTRVATIQIHYYMSFSMFFSPDLTIFFETLETLDAFTVELSWKGVNKNAFFGWLASMPVHPWHHGKYDLGIGLVVGGTFF